MLFYRCVANRVNLDEDALPRTREYTETLIEEALPGDLWEDFGIVAQLVVHSACSSWSHSYY